MAGRYIFFRSVPLFADLSDADLKRICQQVKPVRLHPGQILFEEGSIGQHAYVIRRGKIEIYKETNGHRVQVAVRQSGEMIGEISLVESSPRSASGRALTESLVYAIDQEQFDRLLSTHPTVARTMLHTVISRLRSLDLTLSQSEKMAQLGTLTAGIAHELNNPASAVKRGAEQFQAAFLDFQEAVIRIYSFQLTTSQLQTLRQLTSNPDRAAYRNPVERIDCERRLEDWLTRIGAADSWEKAPLLADLGYEPAVLERALAGFPSEALPALVDWITSSADLENISNEMGQGASQISEIVKALKTYVYLDQAPVQQVNIPEGLENTLVILRHKLRQGIELERVYDPRVPTIQAYAGELNQVWTNIIDNAIDALGGHGKITIRTMYNAPWVIVDIADNGPGIPPEVQTRLFSPFYTTKPLGKGTGLGLNISYNIIHKHGGDVRVISQPGETHFEVWLPEDFKKGTETSALSQPFPPLAVDRRETQ